MRSVISLLVILYTTVWSASEGEAGPIEFLPLSVASGMGQINVLVPSDANFYYNPALLPFSLDGTVMCGGSPVKPQSEHLVTFWTEYAAFRIPLASRTSNATTRWDFAGGFQRVSSDYVGWDKYVLRNNLVTAAISRRGKFDLGFGVSARFIRAAVTYLEFQEPEMRSSGFSYDLGLFGRFPVIGPKADGLPHQHIQLQLVSGLALTEAGKPYEVGYYPEEQPHAWRAGLGLEAYFDVFRILACTELQRWISDRSVSHMYGGEVEWRRFLTIRAGYSRLADGHLGYSSVGLTASTRGLVAFVSNQRIRMPFDIRGHYAHMNSWPWGPLNGDQWGLQLSI